MGNKNRKSWQRTLVYLLLLSAPCVYDSLSLMLSSSFKELLQIFIYPPK